MQTALSITVVGLYVSALTYVAVRARAGNQYLEFSIARRALPLALVFGSLAATYVGPAFSIGFVGKGFQSGFLFFFIGLAYALQNILVGLFIAPRLRRLSNCSTLGEAIGEKYNRTCHIIAGVISVGLCAGFAAVMAIAGAKVLNDIFGLPILSSVIIVVGVTTLYTTFGGLRASVMTDAFQFAAFAIFLPVLLLVTLFFASKGTLTDFSVHAVEVTKSGFGTKSPLQITGLVAAWFLGETLIPPYANRALASRTTGISRNGFILAGFFSIVWFAVMIGLGIAAGDLVAKTTQSDDVLLRLVEKVMSTPGRALLSVVLISVVMSSLDSLLNAGAVSFTEDIVRPFKGLSENSALQIGRAATIIIAMIAAIVAVVVPEKSPIIKRLLVCYTIWAPAILPALIIGLWIKRPKPLAGILSMLTGTVAAIVLQIVFPEHLEEAAILPALCLSLLAYFVGYLFGGSNGQE